MLEDIFTTFPDWHVEIVDMVTEDDSVVMRCKVSGTHRDIGKIPVNGGMLVRASRRRENTSKRIISTGLSSATERYSITTLRVTISA